MAHGAGLRAVDGDNHHAEGDGLLEGVRAPALEGPHDGCLRGVDMGVDAWVDGWRRTGSEEPTRDAGVAAAEKGTHGRGTPR